MTKRVFIDGEAGTTGLEIFTRLAGRTDVEMIRLGADKRKDAVARREALNGAHLVVLCLPDDAAVEAVAMVENPSTRVLDASSAHRTRTDWVYGFAEMCPGQADRIAGATRVANPGCYATGAIALLRPLIDAGILGADFLASLAGVSGYSGGGKSLIAAYENEQSPDRLSTAFFEYGLNFDHKHVPEIVAQSGLTAAPLFIPSVGRYPRGMLVSLPLHLGALKRPVDGAALHAVYEGHYPKEGQVRVQALHKLGKSADADWKQPARRLEADALANTDWLDIHVYCNDEKGQALAVASLDNLGKGACGAAIQNLELMLGL